MASGSGVLAVASPGARRLRRALAAATVLAFVPGLRPAVAAPPVPDAKAGANKPTMDRAPNGVPIVQITAPSAGGVSHNKFTSYDVDAAGLILNNSSTITSTQLGGLIGPNGNLAGGSAKVILNEVTGSAASSLLGYQEVAGPKAEVVIANPNGITCNGCGFINAGRATLTTGAPIFGGAGSLDGFRVLGGAIRIEGAGLDAKTTDQLDLLARTIAVNAGVWASRLDVVTGANEIARGDGSAMPVVPSGPAPQVSLDVGALGGMYAGKIRLVGTERGVGVTSAGTIAAAGEFTLRSDGHIVLGGSTTAGEALTVTARQGLDTSGTVHAGGALTVNATGAMTNTGSLSATGEVQVGADGLVSSGTIAAGVNAYGAVTSTSALLVQSTGRLDSSGKLLAGGAIDAGGTSIDLTGGVVQAGAGATIQTTGDLLAENARIEAGSYLLLQAKKEETPSAVADDTKKLANALHAAGATIAAHDLEIEAGDVNLGPSTSAATHVNIVGAVAIKGTNGVAAPGASIHAGGAIEATSEAGRVELGGGDVAGATVWLDGQSLGLVGARVGAQSWLELHANDADGPGIAAGRANLSAGGALYLGRYADNHGDPVRDATARVETNGATLLGATVDVQSKELVLAGASVRSVGSLSVSAAAGDVDLTSGALDANGALTVHAAGTVWNVDGSILSEQVTVEAGRLVSTGETAVIAAAGDLKLYVSGDVWNADGSYLYAGNDLELGKVLEDGKLGPSGDVVNDTARIEAGHDLTLLAASLRNVFIGSPNATPTTGVLAGNDLTITAGPLYNSARLEAGHDHFLTADTAVNVDQLSTKGEGASPTHVDDVVVDPLAPTSTTPDFQFTVPAGGLYKTNENPGHPLVETDPRFTDFRTFLTSQYMIDRLPSSPDAELKRLGDGYYEQQLVLDQLAFLTGRRFLPGESDAQAQYQALMDAGVLYAQKFQLTVGVALTAEQVASLTSPIVWLEKQKVGGTELLVTKVYVPSAQRVATQGRGWITAGNDLTYSSKSDYKIGQAGISAGGSLSVTANRIEGDGGTHEYGKDLSLTAEKGIDLGTTSLSAAGNLKLKATAGDVTSSVATTSTITRTAEGGKRDVTVTGAHLGAGGDITIEARGTGEAGNVKLDAATIVTESGAVTITADRNVALGAAQERHDTWDAGWNNHTGATTTHATAVFGATVHVDAKNDVSIQAGVVSGKDGVTLIAGRDLTLTTAQDTSTEHHQAGSDYQRTEKLTQARTSVGSELGSITISAGRDATLTGAVVVAGKDVDVKAARNLTLAEANDSVTTESRQGRHTERRYDEHPTQPDPASDTPQGSVIQAGGAVKLAALGTAKGDEGTPTGRLLTRGASVHADGAITVYGKDVQLLDAREVHEVVETDSHTKKRFLSSKTTTTRDETRQDLSVGTLLSGDTVTVESAGSIQVRGSQIVGDGDVSLTAADDIEIEAGEDFFTEHHDRVETRSGFLGGTGGLGFTVGTRRKEITTDVDGVSHQRGADEGGNAVTTASVIGSNKGNLTLDAGKKLDLRGSNLFAATGDITGSAQDVLGDSVYDTTNTKQVVDIQQSGFSVSLSNKAIDAGVGAYQSVNRGREVKDKRLAALYALRAARQADEGWDAARAYAKPEGDHSVTVNIGASHSESRTESNTFSSTALGSSIKAGGKVYIHARGDGSDQHGDVTFVGSTVSGGTVELDAARDIHLRSAENRLDTSSDAQSWSVNAGVALTAGKGKGAAGYSVSGDLSKSDDNGHDVSHTETQITSTGTVTLRSGRDTTVKGALVKGEKLKADIAGNLLVESEQDTSTYHSTSESASGQVVVGYGVSASVTLGIAELKSTYASVNEQSGLFAGKGGYDIHVGKNTHLAGAVIASEADPTKNVLDTGTLTYSNLENRSRYSATSASITASISTAGGGGITPTVGSPIQGGDKSTTFAAIAPGKITIRDGPQDVSGLSRDTAHANNTIGNGFDKQKIQEQKELVDLAGKEGMKAVGDLGKSHTKTYELAQGAAEDAKDYLALASKDDLTDDESKRLQERYVEFTPEKANAQLQGATQVMANNQAEYDTWKDGGLVKTTLHATVGAFQAGLGGGSILAGGLGAGTSEALSPITAKLPQALRPFASLGIGAIAGRAGGGGTMGSIAGGAAAEYGYQFNRKLHDDEKTRIHEIAAARYRELGYETVAEAEAALGSVACAMVHCSAQLPYDQRAGSPESKLEEAGNYTASSRPDLVSVLDQNAGSFTDEFGRPKKMFGYTNETDEHNSDSYLDDRRAYGPWRSGKAFPDRCQGGVCRPAYVSGATPRDWQAIGDDKSLTEHNAETFLEFQNGLFGASGDAAANKKALESELRAKYGNEEYTRRRLNFDETGARWALDSPTGLLQDPSAPHPYWSATDKAYLYAAVTGHVPDLRDYTMVETAAGRPITEADLLQRGIVLVDIDGLKQQAAMFAFPILAEGVAALGRGTPPRVSSSEEAPGAIAQSSGRSSRPSLTPEQIGNMGENYAVSPEVGELRVPQVFTSKDPLVGDLATRIDSVAPGRVVDINRVVRDPVTGTTLTDLDIELLDAVIQVKSGAKLGGGAEQVVKSSELTGKDSLLYAPKLKPGAVAEAQRQGVEVIQTWDELKARLGL